MYAPTQDHKLEQNNFSIKLKNKLAPFVTENILLGGGGGDFNQQINPKLDTMDNMMNRQDNLVYRKQALKIYTHP